MQTIPDHFQSIIDVLNPNSELYNNVGEIAAIWITSPVLSNNNGKHPRWEEGDKCKIVEGKLVDFYSEEDANSIITSCKGNINNSVLMFSVVDLKSGVMSTIKIK